LTAIALIAQRILDENHYAAPSNISLTNMEYLVKNATDYINLQAGTSISFTPAAGAATLTALDGEIIATKAGSLLMLKAYVDRGPNVSITGISVSTLINDPQYAFWSELFKNAIEKLKGHVGVAFAVGSDDADLS
jgi:hypothetical protein